MILVDIVLERNVTPKGEFRQSLSNPTSVVGATKWCVFRQTTPTRAVVENAINERMVRMRSQSVDLLQVRSVFHEKFSETLMAHRSFTGRTISTKDILSLLDISGIFRPREL